MTDTRQLVRFTRMERAMPAIVNAIRVRPRTALVAASLAIVTVGIAMNWSALVAAGVAPLLISALPCAVMCALGLCMSRMGGSSCAMEAQSQEPAAAEAGSFLGGTDRRGRDARPIGRPHRSGGRT